MWKKLLLIGDSNTQLGFGVKEGAWVKQHTILSQIK